MYSACCYSGLAFWILLLLYAVWMRVLGVAFFIIYLILKQMYDGWMVMGRMDWIDVRI
jgi:hypothetical protein